MKTLKQDPLAPIVFIKWYYMGNQWINNQSPPTMHKTIFGIFPLSGGPGRSNVGKWGIKQFVKSWGSAQHGNKSMEDIDWR